jgi:protein phosphatase
MQDSGIRLRSSARTSTGQVRENNEDHVHLWTNDEFVLAIIADGMGGAAAGEEASRIAVETIRSGMVQEQIEDDDVPITERLRDAIQLANLNIVRKALVSPEMRGMGTTLTMVFIRGTYATFAHIGDSRAYWVQGEDQSISQVTSDHSFVQALVNSGHLPQEEAESHPMAHVLYRALGQAEEVDIDIHYKRLHIGDRLVLCSDGLTRHVKSDEIATISLTGDDPDLMSQRLIDLANARGGEDNISVIVIAVEKGETTPLAERMRFADDEDATLILKKNPIKELASTPPPDEEDTSPSKPVVDDEVPTSEAKTDPRKSTAERLKDDNTPTVDMNKAVTGPLDAGIMQRSTLIETPIVRADDSPPRSEGRDTLVPDQ